jgi:hypothetical protein
VKNVLKQAVRATRAAWLRIAACLSVRYVSVPGPASGQGRASTTCDCDPDLLPLTALFLSGLLDPEAALAIALVETRRAKQRRRDH